jgi:hypothetical protein
MLRSLFVSGRAIRGFSTSRASACLARTAHFVRAATIPLALRASRAFKPIRAKAF